MSVTKSTRQLYDKLKDEGKLKYGMWYVLYGDELLFECTDERYAIDWAVEDCKKNNRNLSHYVMDQCGCERRNRVIHISS